MEMYERNKAIDILKAIGIVLVVMGHTGSGFTAYIYTFHMGLFFFVSGYLSYGKRKIESKEFIKKKCKHVLIPYVLFWSVSMIVSEIQSYLYMHSFTKLEVNHWLGLILGGHWLIIVLIFRFGICSCILLPISFLKLLLKNYLVNGR